MNLRRTIVKQAGTILMALGGILLFSIAMIGPAIEPPVDTEIPALIALGLIAAGLVVVMIFRRETRSTSPAKSVESSHEAHSEPVTPNAKG